MMNKIILIPKNLLLHLILFMHLASCNNNNDGAASKPAAEPKPAAVASYYLPVPPGWTTERISFPIEFAPGINYKGTEDLRFAKGWDNVNSEEHWCYAFAWWLDGKPQINEIILQKNLTEYYSGLVGLNVMEKKIPANKVVPTVATITLVPSMKGDNTTYTGRISMLDYHSENAIILNCMIHVKDCDTKEHTGILVEISPRPFDHAVWKQLNALNTNFSCD
ncbi:MAG: hypothetical protein WKI04_02440 [Ferruginibacter sp.]